MIDALPRPQKFCTFYSTAVKQQLTYHSLQILPESRVLTANNITTKLTNQFLEQETLKAPSTADKHFSLDSEDYYRSACRNVRTHSKITVRWSV